MSIIIPRRPDIIPYPKKRPPMQKVRPPKEDVSSEDKGIIYLDNEVYIKDENILKFYYCKSEDDYFLGQRVDNFYYARYNKDCGEFVWCLSRYLPWGQTVSDKNTLWKEHAYPSEPVEIDFSDWLKGFSKKYYGA